MGGYAIVSLLYFSPYSTYFWYTSFFLLLHQIEDTLELPCFVLIVHMHSSDYQQTAGGHLPGVLARLALLI